MLSPITVIFIYLVVIYILVGVTLLSKSTGLNQEQLAECQAVHGAWNELFKTWTLPIIHALSLKHPARFNELKRRIDGISSTSLAERLNELDHLGVIERRVYAKETPPRVEYSLTEKGIDLTKIIEELIEWAKRWADKPPVEKAPILEKVTTPIESK